MTLLRYDIGKNITLESETDVRTLRLYKEGIRVASLNIVATGFGSCRIKNLAMSSGHTLKPSTIKDLLKWLKEECGYKEISWERYGDDGFVIRSSKI